MSSNENLPALSLSDIMHPMSPSPAPAEDQLPAPLELRYDPDAQQEPLTESEVLVIRNRLQELGLVVSYGADNEEIRLRVANHLNLRERELTDMILRLTNCPRIDPVQLEGQASTISTLTSQREYLIADAEEERLKLESERESWNRVAEALLTQKTRPMKTEDMDVQRAAYEAEIKSLREKLHDRHRRLSTLEQEILRLKPLLLMQPYSNQRVKQTLVSQSQTIKIQEKGKRRDGDSTPSSLNIIPPEVPQKFDPTAYPYGYQYRPEVSIPSGQSSNSHTFLLEGPPASTPGSQRRRSKDHSNIQKVKKQKHYRSTTMSSDAYAEHVLLAAQKIGRKRAALVTGLQRLADREKEALARENEQLQSKKEQERLEKERLDRLASGAPSMTYYRPLEDSGPHRDAGSTSTGSRTPRRGGYPHNANPGGVNTPSPSTYVFVNTSATRISKPPTSYGPGSILKTPSRHEASLNSSPTRLSQTTNPPTPLDSLVDAARMMGESGDRGSGRRRLPQEPESPTAKRRKVSTDRVLANRGISRVPSGLDVLADQAAAVNKPSTQPSDSSTHAISDRKGKGKATAQATDTEWSGVSKSRISTRTVRPPSRRLFVSSHDGLPSASSPAGRGTTGTHRHDATPEPRVIALPPVASSGFDSSGVRVGLNLRPVSGWGNRPAPDEDEEDSNSDSTCDSPTRRGLQNETPRVGPSSTRDPSGLELHDPPLSPTQPERELVLPTSVALGARNDNSEPAPVNGYDEETSTWARTPTQQHIADGTREVTPQALAQSTMRRALATDKSEARQSPLAVEHPVSELSSQPSQPPSLAPVLADDKDSEECVADAAGSDEDEDAEGEDDEENTENDAELASKYHSSRSRSPPPPPPGNDNGPGPSNEQDPDKDADGDMDVDDKGTPSSGTSPTSHQTRGGYHRQTATFGRETWISIKPGHIVSMCPINTQCLTASSRQLSFSVQLSKESIHTMPFHRGTERDDNIFDTIVGYCPISKSASLVSH